MATYIVCWMLKGSDGDMTDFWCPHDTEAAARAHYDALSAETDTYHASLTLALDSTDYDTGTVTPTMDRGGNPALLVSLSASQG